MTANTSVSRARKTAFGLIGAVAVTALPLATAGAASAATPTNACGTGYTYKSSYYLRNANDVIGGRVRLYKNSSGTLCATTERLNDAADETGPTLVALTPSGGSRREVSGNYSWFAGPVKLNYSQCVRVSASVSTDTSTYTYSHYGWCHSTTTSASSKAEIAIAAAKAQLGEPYLWGATGPDRWDCSGLTGYAMAKAGVRIPRVSRDQYAASTHVSTPRAGDLVFFGSPVYHVGLYIGDGKMIHAPKTGDVVKISSVYSQYESPKFGRVL